MVDITIVNGVYKPTYNWGAPSCRIWGEFLQTGFTQKCLEPYAGLVGDFATSLLNHLESGDLQPLQRKTAASSVQLCSAARNCPFTGISNWETCNRCSIKLLQAGFSYVQLPGIVHSHGHGNPNIMLI